MRSVLFLKLLIYTRGDVKRTFAQTYDYPRCYACRCTCWRKWMTLCAYMCDITSMLTHICMAVFLCICEIRDALKKRFEEWTTESATGAQLCAHTEPILLSIFSDLYFLCHVKTVTGVSPKAKTMYHCLLLYLCIYLLLQLSGIKREHHNEFGTQAMCLWHYSFIESNRMVLPSLDTFLAVHSCWAG